MRITIETQDDLQPPTEVKSEEVALVASGTLHDGGSAVPYTESSQAGAGNGPAAGMTLYNGGAARADPDAMAAVAGEVASPESFGGEHEGLHGSAGEGALDGGPAAGEPRVG